ncbi:cadherin-like domain-containing protein [Microvirga terricola]|uniref:Cadherin-like domain-containing protein n=1 Tax=Microvirga terricola TaxID=2719797 RepID=A0ABX0V5X3_9HYPH|nr:cadherin-like domain-containing protein [Microvirga terricola]NIX75194.1 cadherin-like domain-containing protein [Microvirga terricola]
MAGSLEGIAVTVTFELQGWFQFEQPNVFTSVIVGNGAELVVPISARILSDTDGDGDMEPVQGPNGLLSGTMTVDISGNQVFASFVGTAQPAGFSIKIEGLAPQGVAPGTIADQGSMNGVNNVYTPNYDAATKTLTLNWMFLGFQPGTHVDQTVFYDNQLNDAPVAHPDFYTATAGTTLNGSNLLANDIDLDNGGPLGVVDLQTITKINGSAVNVGQWTNLSGGGRVLVNSNGTFQFSDNGNFADLAQGQTRTTSFTYTVTDSTGLNDTATATITVQGVNDAPVISGSLATTALNDNDTGATLNLFKNLTVADPDTGESDLTLTITLSNPAAGTLSGAAFTSSSNGVYTITGLTPAAATAILDSIVFTPTNNTGSSGTFTTGITVGVHDGTVAGTTSVSNTTVTITRVNDAPVLNVSKSPALNAIDEDSPAPANGSTAGSTAVSTLIGSMGISNFSDVDGDAAGIAITGVSSKGTLYYSINGGATWTALAAVSASSALVLYANATTLIYFKPNPNETGDFADGITFKAWDRTSGHSNGATGVNTTTGKSFSTATDTASITVIDVNEKPNAGGDVTVSAPGGAAVSILEDATPGAANIQLTPTTLFDLDGPTPTQVRIMSVTGGTLKLADGTPITFGAAGTVITLTNGSVDLRFTPDADRNTDANFQYVVVDNEGANSPASTATVKITPVADTPSVANPTILEDTDSGAIVITRNAADGSEVTHYKITGITGGKLYSDAAFTHEITDGTFIPSTGATTAVYFRPTHDSNDPGSFTVQASTSAINAGLGGSSATSTIAITPVNDAPTLTGGTITLTGTDEDTTSAATTVAALLAQSGHGDIDASALSGIAVTATNGNGTWEYSVDGLTWHAFGSVSGGAALLLSATSLVRYMPDGDNAENAGLSFRAWDRTTGSASDNSGPHTASTLVNGGTTAFSSQTASATIAVTAINDAPVLSNGGITTWTEGAAGTAVAPSLSLTDVDSATLAGGTVTITNFHTGDTLAVGTPGPFTASYDSATGVLTLTGTGTVAELQTALRSVTYSSTSANPTEFGTDNTRTISIQVSDGAAEHSQSNTVTSSVLLIGVNDQPVIGVSPHTTEYVPGSAVTVDSGLTLSDVDSTLLSQATITLLSRPDGIDEAMGLTSAAANLAAASGLTLSYNGVTGTLTILGSTTIGIYEQVLRGITYTNTNAVPDESDRTVAITVRDAGGSNSVPVTKTVAYNTLPVVSFNTGATVAEGSADNTITATMLQATDAEAPGQVTYTVTTGPAHGTLYLSGTALAAGATFTQADINAGRLKYAHDGLEAATDGFGFSITDAAGGTRGNQTFHFTVTQVNDAPVITPAAPTLPSITEDAIANGGATVASIFGASVTDPDPGALSGIAVTGLVSSIGQWEYSLDGGAHWTAIGTVSNSAALLLRATDLVRFVPDSKNGTTASLTYRAWDQTGATAGHEGTKVNVTATGGQSPFSTTTDTATITVNGVNDAPVLIDTNVSPILVGENAGAPVGTVGTLVSALVGTRNVTDIDAGALAGIVVTQADETNGTWWYTTDGGATWLRVGTLTPDNARLLPADANTRIYFEPDAAVHGMIATALTFHAWDRSVGTNGNIADAMMTGGTTPFSTASDSVDVWVNTLVDGTPVHTETHNNLDGSITQVITIPVVEPTRSEEVGNNTVADIPLVQGNSGGPLLLAQLPVGFGLEVTGPTAPKDVNSALADILLEINAHTDANSSDRGSLRSGASSFLQSLPGHTDLLVQTIVPTTSGAAPGAPLVISGNPSATGVATALVVDTRNLPSGSSIQLQNVEFAAVIGAIKITGGDGAQFVWGDSANQYMVLGADDDTLHGGGGNDYVGSLGGNDMLYGDAGNDTVSGGIGNDLLFGGEGLDQLLGGDGNDHLNGGMGQDRMAGDKGNDIYIVDDINDLVIEGRGEGTDTIYASTSYIAPANIENLILTGQARLGYANNLDNLLRGNAENNILLARGGNDKAYGGDGNDRIEGENGNDRLYGQNGHDRLLGGNGNDTVDGGTGNDSLYGGTGNDVLIGREGNDLLHGGLGADRMTGGSGADTFMFRSLSDSSFTWGIDVIDDFSAKEKDKIDLSVMDANSVRADNQAFSFIGASAFSHTAGELRYEAVAGGSYVYGDVNGDGVADIAFFLKNVVSLKKGDFFL